MARLGRSKAVMLAGATIREFADDACPNLAASIAYFGFLSLFPLVILLTAIFGQILESPGIQQQLLAQVGNYLPGSLDFVSVTIQGAVKARGPIGVLSGLVLLWSATGIFGSLSAAFKIAWDVKTSRPFIRDNALNLGLAIASAVFLAVSVALTGSFHFLAAIDTPVARFFGAGIFWGVAGFFLPFSLTVAMFLMIYKFLPNTRVRWRDASIGAILAAILFEAAKNIFAWYLQNIGNFNAVYGSVGTVAVLLTWIYVSSIIALIGAEFSSVYAEQGRSAVLAREPVPGERQGRVGARGKPSNLAIVVGVITVALVASRAIASIREGKVAGRGPLSRFIWRS
ncbi:MAG: YihY/virulence factor BrkB family protein [Dehalococcoidia bacterium]|nr:YihY/virulence factor BrkB family protein [Dehalococcoidia bacterium]